jgi:hypothetical protein
MLRMSCEPGMFSAKLTGSDGSSKGNEPLLRHVFEIAAVDLALFSFSID